MEQWNSVKTPPETKVSHRENTYIYKHKHTQTHTLDTLPLLHRAAPKHIYIHTYIHFYTHTHTHARTHTHTHTHTHAHTHTYIHTYIHTHNIYMCVCVCVCTHTTTHTPTHTHRQIQPDTVPPLHRATRKTRAAAAELLAEH
jgi:hypothetical protein